MVLVQPWGIAWLGTAEDCPLGGPRIPGFLVQEMQLHEGLPRPHQRTRPGVRRQTIGPQQRLCQQRTP